MKSISDFLLTKLMKLFNWLLSVKKKNNNNIYKRRRNKTDKISIQQQIFVKLYKTKNMCLFKK